MYFCFGSVICIRTMVFVKGMLQCNTVFFNVMALLINEPRHPEMESLTKATCCCCVKFLVVICSEMYF